MSVTRNFFWLVRSHTEDTKCTDTQNSMYLASKQNKGSLFEGQFTQNFSLTHLLLTTFWIWAPVTLSNPRNHTGVSQTEITPM